MTIFTQRKTPVFFDGHRRRWKIFVGSISIGLTAISLLYSVAIISITYTSVQPAVNLPKPAHTSSEGTLAFSSLRNSEKEGKNMSMAFYVNEDPAAFTSLTRHSQQISTLLPEWLHVLHPDGQVEEDSVAERKRVMSYLNGQIKKPTIIPLINNYDSRINSWMGKEIAIQFTDSHKRLKLIASLAEYVTRHHFGGILLDFEDIPSGNEADYLLFTKELHTRFYPMGLTVIQTVQAFESKKSYTAYLEGSDYLYLPLIEGRWGLAGSGPVNSMKWFENVLKSTVLSDAGRWIIGIGNYGYDTNLVTHTTATVSVSDALQNASEYSAVVRYDEYSGNLTYRYRDEKKDNHVVWYADTAAFQNQSILARRAGVRAFALWRLGTEDESMWRMEDANSKNKTNIAFNLSYDLKYEGEGEISRLSNAPLSGNRTFSYDADGLVKNESIRHLPSSYTIKLWGATQARQIALTFDDGPDPRYTEDIVAILQHYHIPATFFVIGNSARQYPDLLKEVYESGNEIGNHTYLHSNVNLISPSQLRFEINATDNVLQTIIGHRSLLFRPPYAIDSEPSKLEHVQPLALTSNMGYYTVDMHIDPNDWRPGRTKKQIVHDVLMSAKSGKGRIVLLHDGGGLRENTVEALPDIIEGLQAEGFHFVRVSSLLGLTREQVMPIAKSSRGLRILNRTAYRSLGFLGAALYYLFVISVLLGLFRLVCTGALAWQQARKKYSTEFNTLFLPRIAVIVPAYNEETVIGSSISSLLNLDYPQYEVLIVDDGSTDDTYQKAIEQCYASKIAKVFTKQNEGKAAAINYALERTGAEVIVTVDADTLLHPMAIRALIRHFDNKVVGAVAGNAKVGNRVNLLTRWQALEYIMGQNLDRRAFAMLNCICVVPGAIGAWRSGVVRSLGGFSYDTLAEDTDLTLAILKEGYQIRYEDEAIAYTEAPSTVYGFIRQRFRWVYGTLQAVWKHRHMFARRRFKGIGMVGLPNLIVFQVFLPLIGPIMDLLLISSFLGLVWQRYQHPESYSLDSLKHIGFYYLFFFILELITGIGALMLEKNEDWNLVFWLPFQRFFYRQLLYFSVVKSVLAAIKGTSIGWGTLRRMGTVSAGAKNKSPEC